MVKFEDFKSDQLKKELSKMGLPIAGTKAEMQHRLREARLQQGNDVADIDFGSTFKESEEPSASQEFKLLMQMMHARIKCC